MSTKQTNTAKAEGRKPNEAREAYINERMAEVKIEHDPKMLALLRQKHSDEFDTLEDEKRKDIAGIVNEVVAAEEAETLPVADVSNKPDEPKPDPAAPAPVVPAPEPVPAIEVRVPVPAPAAPGPALAEICQRHSVAPEKAGIMADCYLKAIQHHHAGAYHNFMSTWHKYNEGLQFLELQKIMQGAWVAFTEDKDNGLPMAGKTVRERVAFAKGLKRNEDSVERILSMSYEEAKAFLGMATKKTKPKTLPKPPDPDVDEPELSEAEIEDARAVIETVKPLVAAARSQALPPQGLDIEKPTYHVRLPETIPPIEIYDGTKGDADRERVLKNYIANKIVDGVILRLRTYQKRHPQGFNVVFETL